MTTGRPAQLDVGQLESLRVALLQGPLAHGFGAELWTLKRVRALIERLYVITFGEVHVWRLLGALGFSSQKPERRAIERNEQAVLTLGSAKLVLRSKKMCRRTTTDRVH